MKKLLSIIAFLLLATSLFAQARVAGLTATELKTFQSLNSVENTALSTWAGSGNITTIGAVTSGSLSTGFTVINVAQGGIGVGTLASNGILYGNGTSAVLALAVNSTATNKFLTQISSGAPAWATIVAGDLPTIDVAHYGTGVATMTTAYAPVCAGTTATGALQVASTGLSTSGYVLTSTGSSSLPSFQAVPSPFTTTAITADQTAAVSNYYVNNKSGSILSITLPATGTVGQTFKIIGGSNTASFKIVYTTNQKIHLGSGTSTVTTGNVTFTEEWASVELTCIVTNNEWEITSYTGTATLN